MRNEEAHIPQELIEEGLKHLEEFEEELRHHEEWWLNTNCPI